MAAIKMDWTYPAGAGDAGIFEIGRRLAEALGRGPDVTRFTYDPRDMLRATREIERAARGGRLLVGFQTADKLSVEADRYAALIAAGTQLTVWATGPRPAHPGLAALDYRSIPADSHRVRNQWFLVADGRESIAFVSYELGDPASFGIGGAATPGKRFVGFVSDDPGVVDLLVREVLSPIAAPSAPSAPRIPSAAALELAESSRLVDAEVPPGAGSGSVVVAVGRGDDRAAVLVALALAGRGNRDLVVVDRSAEGFASPYTDLRGDDAYRPDADTLFGAAVAYGEGRQRLAVYLEAAAAAGVTAGGWFPTHAGYGGMAEAARRFGGALFVLPPDAAHPGLAERLRGMVPERLRAGTGVPVIVAPPSPAVSRG
jgi:hypothetical protein